MQASGDNFFANKKRAVIRTAALSLFPRKVHSPAVSPIWLLKSRRPPFHPAARLSSKNFSREEKLRLRAYEKLQNLVAHGMVKKDGKKYKGIPKQLATLETFPPRPTAPVPVA